MFDEVYFLFHFTIILEHNGLSSTNILAKSFKKKYQINVYSCDQNILGKRTGITFEESCRSTCIAFVQSRVKREVNLVLD